MSQRTEKFKPCRRCATGRVRTDEIGKKFNAKIDGKPVCPQCKLDEIMAGFGNRPNMDNDG